MDRLATGVDLCLDVHGDEALPHNFIAGAESITGWTPRLVTLQARFLSSYVGANPDSQTQHGSRSGQHDDLHPQIAQRFDCLSMTLEMPFKDNADAPDPVDGWSPARCRCLGASVLDVVHTLR